MYFDQIIELQDGDPDDHNTQDNLIDHKDVELDWKKYTMIEDIHPNDQIHLFIEPQNKKEINMPIICDLIQKTHFDSTFTK